MAMASPIAGFASPLAYSSDGGQYTDFVLVNGNVAGNGLTRQAGVVRYTAGTAANYLLHTSNQVGGTLYPTTTYAQEVTTGEISIGGLEILKVHEVYLGDPPTIYRFTLNCLSGIPDLDMAIYDAHTSYFGKSGYLAGGDLWRRFLVQRGGPRLALAQTEAYDHFIEGGHAGCVRDRFAVAFDGRHHILIGLFMKGDSLSSRGGPPQSLVL